jgi:hypothetical protein
MLDRWLRCAEAVWVTSAAFLVADGIVWLAPKPRTFIGAAVSQSSVHK